MHALPQLQSPSDMCEEKYSLIKDLSDVILLTDNLGALGNMILDIVATYTGAAKTSLMLINERRELNILASRGIDLDIARNYRSKPGEGIAGTVLRMLEPVLVADIGTDERFNEMKVGEYKTGSFVSCPIMGKKKLLGILNASDRKDSAPFSRDDFCLLQIITHHTAIALENAQLIAKLKGKTAELEDMNRKLMETDLIKTEFLTRISHELRTPLNSVKGSVYLLEQSEKLTRGEQKEFFSIIARETDKLAAIVENQLDFLAFEDEMRSIRKTVVSLEDLLAEVSGSRALNERLERQGQSVVIETAKGAADVVCDKIKVAQMLLNLIEGLSAALGKGAGFRISTMDHDCIKVALLVDTPLTDSIRRIFSQPDYPFREEGRDDKLKIYLARKVADAHGWELSLEEGIKAFTVMLTIPKSRRQKIDTAVGRSIDLFLEFIAELLGIDTCSIMLRDSITGELRIQSAMGLSDEIVKRTRIKPGDQISGWVALEGKPLLIENIEKDVRFSRLNIPQYNTKSLLSVPLKAGDKVIGVMNLNNKKTAEPFTMQDLSVADILGARVSRLLERLNSDEHWDEGFREFTSSFAKLLQAGKRYHKKTGLFRDLIGKMMELLETAEEERKLAVYASSIYDLGLMLMDDVVFDKGRLEPSDFASLRVHPFTTIELLNGFEFSPEVRKAILHHHEKYDGSGYPDGLAGNDIPAISRVLSVVDGYCSMMSKRPHRNELSEDDALAEIRKNSGTWYDPAVVAALEEALRAGNA